MFFRVLLVVFGLFRPGAARAPFFLAYIYKNEELLISAIGRNSLYYIDIVINSLPSKKINKVK